LNLIKEREFKESRVEMRVIVAVKFEQIIEFVGGNYN